MSASAVRPEWLSGVIVKMPEMPTRSVVASIASRSACGSVPASSMAATPIFQASYAWPAKLEGELP